MKPESVPVNKWFAFAQMNPAMQAKALLWIKRRLKELARSGNSPKRADGWAESVAPECRAWITPGGDVVFVERIPTDAAAKPVSLFATEVSK